MLWLYLQDGVLSEVYAKRYILWGHDDEGVYGFSERLPTWESDDFEDTFP